MAIGVGAIFRGVRADRAWATDSADAVPVLATYAEHLLAVLDTTCRPTVGRLLADPRAAAGGAAWSAAVGAFTDGRLIRFAILRVILTRPHLSFSVRFDVAAHRAYLERLAAVGAVALVDVDLPRLPPGTVCGRLVLYPAAGALRTVLDLADAWLLNPVPPEVCGG